MSLKKIIYSVLTVFCVFVLTGCVGIKDNTPLYVYSLGIDNSQGIYLYALIAEQEDVSSEQAKQKDKTQGENEESANAKILVYGADSVENAFAKLIEDNKNIYTGTIKEYVAGASLDEETLLNFKVYIANSPRLPTKRKTVLEEDVYMYMTKRAPELIR